MAATLAAWADKVPWLVPSTDPTHPNFEPVRYWRGPIWAVVNWMIAQGFTGQGHPNMGKLILDQTRSLIGEHGLMEYFDPTNGRGVGGADFSWTAAIYLMLA
jgi:glycogen debranching enzyme